MDIFTTVKAAVTVRQAAEHYGLQVNRNGMALCPFHNDRHPSLYVSDDHYHCFACGEHGDVIDLTAKLFGLRLYDAAQKLASDFHFAPDKPLPEAIRRKIKHNWIGQSVVGILERMEYTGCTCNFKTYSKSYKLKKRIPNAIEDMCIFPDTQEAIVSQAQWDRVQELRKNKRRPTKAQRQGLFSGLLFCPDCGNKLHFATSLTS